MREKTVSKGKYYSEQFGTVRTIYDCNEKIALFCAKDVAKALGFGNPSASVRDICLNCVKEAHMTDGGLQVMNFIGWDDIARLYHHCRNQELYPYIEYLCNIETDMYEKACGEADKCNCPACDIERNGENSEYCDGFCYDCEYSDYCDDFCCADCESCPYCDECNADEMPLTDSYEDTHDPNYQKLFQNIGAKDYKKEIDYKSSIIEIAETLLKLVNRLYSYSELDITNVKK